MSNKMDVNEALKSDPETARKRLFEAQGDRMATPAESAATEAVAAFNKSAPLAASLFADSLATMVARAKKEATPVPLPWPGVAEALGGGLWPGLHVLTGTTGSGKTQLALQAAFKAACSGIPTLYIGLELGPLDLTARLLALAEGESSGAVPPWSSMYLGKTDAAELESLGHAHAATLKGLPFHAEFGPPMGWSAGLLSDRVAAMRGMYSEKKPLFVVLDYLQAVGATDDRADLRERIGKAAYVGRAVAREHDAAVLMLSSVSRDNVKRLRVGGDEGNVKEDTSPAELVGLGKESGEIEYAADTVLALAAEPYAAGRPTAIRLAVAKMRAGAPQWCDLTFNGSTFSELAPITTTRIR